MYQLIRLVLISIFSLFLFACGTSNYESAGEYLDSSATTTKVKARLVDQLGTSGFSIKVRTFKDIVQLSGFVDTLRVKQKAGLIAARTSGVRSVRNGIVVKPQ